jgi:hypothetical protein
MTPVITQCKSCSSSRLLELDAEMCLHFPVLGGLDKPPIFCVRKAFRLPRLRICTVQPFGE